MAHLLLVDDVTNVRRLLAQNLDEAGHQVVEAEDGRQALELLDKGVYDLVITDMRMGDVDGFTVLKEVKRRAPSTEVIVMTAYGTIQDGVEAMKAGANDYLSKPVRPADLLHVVAKALEKQRMGDHLRRLKDSSAPQAFVSGSSPAFQRVLEKVAKVAPTNAQVLLTGESGVGKEVVADLIHSLSSRKDAPLHKINLGAISETLQESELFGHVRGSFTGATAARKGLFMEADGATLFMDEIGTASPRTQISLLRVLQANEVRPVGGDRLSSVDVRVIAATNSNLPEAVADGSFREDLFFRINVVPIEVPALRDRVEDIPDLAVHLLRRHASRLGRPSVELTTEAHLRLQEYNWPGNVRELENVLERTLILVPGDEIRADDLLLEPAAPALPVAVEVGTDDPLLTLAQVERRQIERTLDFYGGHKQKAAESLGIARATLFRKLKEYATSSK
ncbi:MAG: sigma-54 dependent transcriptional regulator [Acidobacteriota bacterium]